MSVLRMTPTIRTAQNKIGYRFKNPQYLWEALQAPGSIVRSGEVQGAGTTYHSKGFEGFPDGNRRLAVVGDAALRLAIVEDWYKGDTVRERLYRVVSDVGSNANLDMIGRDAGLVPLINKHPKDSSNAVSPTTMASTVEAIIGAVYLDSGIKSVATVMQNLGLTPKLVRRTGMKGPLPENSKSPATSGPPTVENCQEPSLTATQLRETA